MRILLSLLASATAMVAAATPAQAVNFVNAFTVAGDGMDLSGLGSHPNLSRFAGFGSDLVYDSGSNLYYGITDRGPGGGLIDYAPRMQAFSLDINSATGAVNGLTLQSTTVFKTATGGFYTGLNPLLATGNASNLGLSFDPEGLARLSDGSLLVSDEYGPSIYKFDASGNFVSAFTIPENLKPKTADGTLDYVSGRPTITTGRQDNRGFEGLTVSADGKTAYAVLQDPLVNEGSSNQGRRSRNVRIVTFDVDTGESNGQFIYRLEDIDDLNPGLPGEEFENTQQGRSIGLSSIQALSDGRLLVLERDNRGWGVEDPNGLTTVALKSAFIVDLTGATDVSAISLAGNNPLPGGVTAASKTLFLDINSALQAAGVPVAEKLEGLTFGPWLDDGSLSMFLISDNDFSVTQTGAGDQFDVCSSGIGAGQTTSQVALGGTCPTGQSLIPTYVYSFTLSATEAASIGLVNPSAVPEPAAWAMMIGGFGLVGGAMRRQKKAKLALA